MPDFESKLFDFVNIVDAQLRKIAVEIKEVRKDLRYHIKRTDLMEAVVEDLEKDITKFKMMLGAVLGVGVALGGVILWLIQVIGGLRPIIQKLL